MSTKKLSGNFLGLFHGSLNVRRQINLPDSLDNRKNLTQELMIR